MPRVARFDTSRLDAVERTPQGGLRAPARLTRTGVLTYRTTDGRERREYRPPSEVFAESSLASLRGATVTDRHPPTGMVTPATFKQLSVGHVGDDVRADGDFVAASVVVNDATEVSLVESGERGDLSCGYDVQMDETPGISPEGERYDAVQRAITYNHVALLPPGTGRAGPEVALRLDGAAWEVPASPGAVHSRLDAAAEKATMAIKLKIGGREFVIRTDAAEAMQQDVTAAQGAADAMQKKTDGDAAVLDAMQKQVTDLLAQIAQLQANAKAAAATAPVTEEQVPETVQDSIVEKRGALVERARVVLGADADLKGKKATEIKRAVVAKAMPAFDAKVLDAISAERLDGMFEAVTVRNDALGDANAAAQGAPGEQQGEVRADADDSLAAAHRAFAQKIHSAGRQSLIASSEKGA